MDQQTFIDIANNVTRLKMYPYFDVCHYVLMCLAVREDMSLTSSAQTFSRKHPFASWLSCLLTCYAGGFISYFLLGEPVIQVLTNHRDILTFTTVWYLVFYSPFDLVYKIVKFLPIKLVIGCLKEVQRAHKIHRGVAMAAKVYPHYYLVIVVIGAVKGCGSGIMRNFERLIRGVWVSSNNEILQPSFITKACLVAASVFTVEMYGLVQAPHSLVYLGVVIFFVYFKLSTLLIGSLDPFMPFENLFCAIFMGGMWDALKRAIVPDRGVSTTVQESRNGTSSKSKDDKKFE